MFARSHTEDVWFQEVVLATHARSRQPNASLSLHEPLANIQMLLEGCSCLAEDERPTNSQMATTQQPDEFSSSGVLHSLEQDPFLKQFVAAVDVSRLASSQMDNIKPSLAKLQNGITLVNRKIRQEVALHEGALLEQAAHIAMLEDALRTAKEGAAGTAKRCFVWFASLTAPFSRRGED